MSELTPNDIYLFREGTLYRAYEKLGAHPSVGAARDSPYGRPTPRP
jgi:hypothetical protein